MANEWEQLNITEEEWNARRKKWIHHLVLNISEQRKYLRKYIADTLNIHGQEAYRERSKTLPMSLDLDLLYKDIGLSCLNIASSTQDAYHHFHFTNTIISAVTGAYDKDNKLLYPCLIKTEPNEIIRLENQLSYYTTLNQYVQDKKNPVNKITEQPNRVTLQEVHTTLLSLERKIDGLIQLMECNKGTAELKRNSVEGKKRRAAGNKAS